MCTVQCMCVAVVDVFWESTHVFVAVYTVEDNDQPSLYLVHVPVGAALMVTHY